jgi:ketosteroid isomerase-like protein
MTSSPEGTGRTAEEALRALCDAWERRDPDAVAQLFSHDGRYEDPLFEQVPVGPDEIRAACAEAIDELAEVGVPLQLVATTGDLVLAEGEFLSRTVDGRRLDFPLAMVLEVRDGSWSGSPSTSTPPLR